MENKYLLTIAIPTFNRENELRSCLDAFCPQLTDEVKLVVRDNCSTNYNFKGFIAPYIKKYCIETFQNPVNIGGDANIARMFEECDTEWLWVCGDDDTPTSTAVSDVLAMIKTHRDFVFIKFRSPQEQETKGIKQLSDVFKDVGEFGNSFFIPLGIHNVGLSKNMMQWHYRFLSTKIAQILRVLKYVELYPEGKCCFTTIDVLADKGVAKWESSEMVSVQLPIFDYFKGVKKFFGKSVFKDIIRYIFIYNGRSNLGFCEKIKNYRIYLIKYGLFNFIKNNGLFFLNLSLHQIAKSILHRN